MTSPSIKFIADARDAGAIFSRAAAAADELWIASAWATDGTSVARALWDARHRLTALAVGIDFHQTDPRFLRRFRTHARVHEVADGTYHPKVYVFRHGTTFEAIVGSSNFTGGGFTTNLESNIHIQGSIRQELFEDLTTFVTHLADGGRQMLDADLVEYEREHERKAALVAGARHYEKRRKPIADNDVPLHLPWDAFVKRLRAQRRRSGHALFPISRSIGYVGVVEEAQEIFRRDRRLSAMSLEDRKKVAGLVSPFTFFGAMTAAGRFQGLRLSGPRSARSRTRSHPRARPCHVGAGVRISTHPPEAGNEHTGCRYTPPLDEAT